MTITEILVDAWKEARTRFSNQLPDVTESNLLLKLLHTQNTVGFLIRHIADVELLFAKNVFGEVGLQVQAKTVIALCDSGEWVYLPELLQYQQYAFESLKQVVAKQTDQDWSQKITTKEFGTKTKAEALGRIISHTAYHAGQLALSLKYGQIPPKNLYS